MSSCTTGEPATWYNHGSRAHYCPACASRLNHDEVNAREAERLFGHTLCTEVEQEPKLPPVYDPLDSVMYIKPYHLFEDPIYQPTYSHPPRESSKVGRNTPCKCGSGKKFKKCCISKEKS